MSPVLKEGNFASRLLGAQWVIDETTAVVSAETDPAKKRTAFWISGAILYASWNIGTLLGALVGSSINPSDFGLDAAFPVMFIAMLAPHLRTTNGKKAALFGAVIAVALAPFMPIGLPILVSALGMLFGLSPEKEVPATSDGTP
jgi:predicted branched-subunit amino acid permease